MRHGWHLGCGNVFGYLSLRTPERYYMGGPASGSDQCSFRFCVVIRHLGFRV